MAKKPEIYVSVDIEADGPIPGPHSMLAIGAVAYDETGAWVDEYAANLDALPDAEPYSQTMEWWQQFPEAWAAIREETRPPETVMPEFADWVEALPGTAIFVAWPATFDFMWIYWYLIRFTGRRPFSEHGIDMRSYAMGMRKKDFRRSGKNYLPQRWFSASPHTHVAIDDAREQGELFVRMVAENLGKEPPGNGG